MSKKHKGDGLSDTVLLIVSFTVVFLYFVSAFMYVDHNEIREAEIECRPKGGLDKYYIHFGAKKFTCIDGSRYEIREGSNALFFLENILK